MEALLPRMQMAQNLYLHPLRTSLIFPALSRCAKKSKMSSVRKQNVIVHGLWFFMSKASKDYLLEIFQMHFKFANDWSQTTLPRLT